MYSRPGESCLQSPRVGPIFINYLVNKLGIEYNNENRILENGHLF